jgi:hypothetical protein
MSTQIKDVQDDIESLLPWHAAGTLSRRDTLRVEKALAADKELARRFELVREELGETIHLNETLGAPSARAMNKLFAMIDAEPARQSKASFNFAGRISQFLGGFSQRTLAYGATAAALAIVLQAGILFGLVVKEQGAGPQLASYETNEKSLDAGSYVLIRFRPQANADAITKFLNEFKATIVGGPATGTGLFRMRVAETQMSTAELGALVKKMAQNEVVGFTVPSAQP